MSDLLEQIQIFKKVVDEKSFAKAARDLSVSPSVVSREISRLEDRIGHKLLLRTTRSMSLTDVGEEYYGRATKLLQDAEELEALMFERKSEPQGLLKMILKGFIFSRYLAPLIPEFKRRFPKVRLVCDSSDRVINIISEGYDISIMVGAAKDSSHLVSIKLGETRDILCASPDYLKKRGAPKSLSDLTEHEVVNLRTEFGTHVWYIEQDGRIVERSFPSSLEVGDPLGHRDLVTAGMGIGLIMECLIREHLRDGRLERVLSDHWVGYTMENPTGVYLVYPRDRFRSPKTRAMVEFLKENLKF